MNRLRESRRVRLVFAALVIALIWLVVLPRLSRLQPVAEHLERLDRHGIEADAMYWTELEAAHFLDP